MRHVELTELERKKAFSAAKIAVRSYAKEPSEGNAEAVKAAWLRVRLQQEVRETVGR